MKVKVVAKQNASKNCIVCGRENGVSLKTDFYDLEDGRIAAVFNPLPEHQSYPGRVHGGIISAVLDETVGRALHPAEPDTWGVTIELNVKFRKPVPYGQSLIAVGEITENSRRFFSGKGVLLLPNGEIAANATAKYMKFPVEKIADFEGTGDYWERFPSESDPTEFDLPDKI